MSRTAAIMVMGTGSDVGKSLLVAGLCRAFTQRGLIVRPFKPQNMSNNAAVAEGLDGTSGEIGRAQALQAKACGVSPHVHMNPVLLKPQTDIGAQVVVQGKVIGSAKARDYYDLKPKLLPQVLDSFAALSDGADLVIVEGAGSPAEVNLRAADIANMGFAEAADLPVLLVGDIDRGGVIASLVGTHALLPPAEQNRIKGFIINKFRGDVSLFDEGVSIIEERTGWPSLGVVPFFKGASALPMEDAFALERADQGKDKGPDGLIKIAVPRLARIANFDDCDPLLAEPGVDLMFIDPGNPIPAGVDLVLIPGSKATLHDMDMMTDQGWAEDIRAHHRRGGAVLGICGGFQILGSAISDPDGLEGEARSIKGLGLLDMETILGPEKELSQQKATDSQTGAAVQGYEMHLGVTTGKALGRPWFNKLAGQTEGAVSSDGLVFGTYMHGIFAEDGFRHGFLQNLAADFRGQKRFDHGVEAALDGLAAHLAENISLARLLEIAQA